MNLIPVATLFGGLTAFFSLAVALRLVVSKGQAVDKQDQNQLAS